LIVVRGGLPASKDQKYGDFEDEPGVRNKLYRHPRSDFRSAVVASVELAPGKARTAALFKKPSQALEDTINHGRVAAITAQGFTEMQGGPPIVVDNDVVGAIGASFDTPEHDVQIARAGLAAVSH